MPNGESRMLPERFPDSPGNPFREIHAKFPGHAPILPSGNSVSCQRQWEKFRRFPDPARICGEPRRGYGARPWTAFHLVGENDRSNHEAIPSREGPPTLFQLADAVGMPHTRLNKGFRKFHGATVFEYPRRERLEKSRWVIDRGKCPWRKSPMPRASP